MLALYAFALVLGGVLLVGSLVLGSDTEADADVDLDADFDADVDLDAEADLDTDVDADADSDGPSHGDLATVFLSLRFWTFFGTFFGLTGVALQGLGLLPSPIVLLVALVVGAVCGFAAALAFRLLSRDEVGTVASSREYVGQTGRMLLAAGPTTTGKIRLTLRGTTVDVLASTRGGESLAPGETALVVEMRGATALVTGLGRDRAAEPPLSPRSEPSLPAASRPRGEPPSS